MTYPTQYGFYFCNHHGTIPAETPTDVSMMEVYSDPQAQEGLRPSRACAERLMWFRDSRIRELEQFAAREHRASEYQGSSYSVTTGGFTRQPSIIPALSREFLDAFIADAKRENPARIEQMRRDWLEAAMWEKKRFGNVAATLRPRRIYL